MLNVGFVTIIRLLSIFYCYMARWYIRGVVKCSLGFGSVPSRFQEIGEWVWRFHKETRSVVVVGVATTIRAIWKTRNMLVFQNVIPCDPCSIMCKVSYVLTNWSCL
jgi:hypothetical protein